MGLTIVYLATALLAATFDAQNGDWLALAIALAIVVGVLILSRWLR